MSKFYIGQMVRVIASENHPNLIGAAFQVVGFCDDAKQGNGKPLTHGLVISVSFYQQMKGPHWAFEPTLPGGLESLEEINALYEPEVVTVEKRA